MDTKQICKRCGLPLPQNAPEGLCPSCLAKVPVGGTQTSQSDGAVVALEVGKILALTALVVFGMETLHSAWPLVALLVGGWTLDRSADPSQKRWIQAVWVFCVLGMCGYGVWITTSAWPVAALFFLFDWGKDKEQHEEEEEDEDDSEEEEWENGQPGSMPFDPLFQSANGDGASAALPFVIHKRVRGPFGVVCGLMRLEADALGLEFEVKSILTSVRQKLREVRIPYKEIALADFDQLHRLVLRTTRTLSLSEVPTSGQGEVTFKPEWDDMRRRAARRFVAALHRRMAGQLPSSQ
jgi:hypothetical protein